MKNEPLDYFSPKKHQTYTLKSYRKLIIVMSLVVIKISGFLFLPILSTFRISVIFNILLYYFLVILFFNLWGLINIFQSYNNGEDKTVKRVVILIFHLLFSSIFIYKFYFSVFHL